MHLHKLVFCTYNLNMVTKQYDKAYPIDKNKLNRNRWMFIKEGFRRGYDIKRIHPRKLIFYVEKNGKGFIYDTLPGSINARMRFPQIANKVFQKKIMEASDISVAKTFDIARNEQDKKKIECNFPCVVKPAIGSRSINVTVNIDTKEKLYNAVEKILHDKSTALIEDQYIGKQYRVMIVNGKFVSCVERQPASVTGDGILTIAELIEQKNTNPERGPRNSMGYTLHYIAVDDVVREMLKKNNLTMLSVLKKGEVFSVTTKINTSVGADLVDRTKEIHSNFVQLSQNCAQRHNLFLVGFDVIAEDISKDPSEQKYIFNELNEQPFFDISEKCNIGVGAPVASIMWDEIEKSNIMTEKFLFF